MSPDSRARRRQRSCAGLPPACCTRFCAARSLVYEPFSMSLTFAHCTLPAKKALSETRPTCRISALQGEVRKSFSDDAGRTGACLLPRHRQEKETAVAPSGAATVVGADGKPQGTLFWLTGGVGAGESQTPTQIGLSSLDPSGLKTVVWSSRTVAALDKIHEHRSQTATGPHAPRDILPSSRVTQEQATSAPSGSHSPSPASPLAPTRLRAVSAPRRRRRVRTPNTRTATVEADVRAVWQSSMSVGQLEKAAKISRNSASKWRKILIAEGLDEPQEVAT